MRDTNYLFADGDLYSTLKNQQARAVKHVEEIPQAQFLNAAVDTVVEHIVSNYSIMPLELHEDLKTLDQQECQVEARSMFQSSPILVPGVQATVAIPFTGNPSLWKLQPNTSTSMRPQGSVRDLRDGRGELILTFRIRTEELSRIKQELDQQLRMIREYLGWQSPQVQSGNSELEPAVRRAIEERRARLKQQSQLTDLLGIPLKKNPDAPTIAALPIKRTLVRPLPAPPRTGFKAEPGVSDEDYEHILDVLRQGCRTFEGAPSTFNKLDEEELRDVLLANLNTHYAGSATGETFRKSGKTDIRIEDQNRAAFVAECKIWSGPKNMLTAIDQLLGYLTWRDCKASLILFNRNVAGFTDLVDKMEASLQSHSRYRSRIGTSHAGEWRNRFESATDPSREVIVHIFIFDLKQNS